MRIALKVRYDDGSEQTAAKEFADLKSACHEALDIADQLGARISPGSRGPLPKVVECFAGDHIQISVAILPGGLRLPAEVER
jgi:hypothetical protein